MPLFVTKADDADGIRADFEQQIVWKTSELGPADRVGPEPESKAFGVRGDLTQSIREFVIKIVSQTCALVVVPADRFIHFFLDADVEPQPLRARSR